MHWKEAVEVWENRVVGFVSPQHCLEHCLMDKPLVFDFKLMGDYCEASCHRPFKGSEISNDLPFM